MADLALKKFEKKSPPPETVKTSDTRFIPATLKQSVWNRDGGRCSGVALDGTKCNSKHALQYEHITPFALGGKTTADNLKLLCPAHNPLSAIQAYGLPKMQKFWVT